MPTGLVSLLYSVSMMLMFMVAIVFSFKRKTRGRADGVFLALMYWCFLLSMLLGLFTGTDLARVFPHLMRTAQVFMLAYMPLSFLYIRQALRPGRLRRTDLLHFLPVVFYLVDYSSFFLLSAEEKLKINESMMKNGTVHAFDEGSFTSAGFHIALRFAVFIAYWIAGYLVLRRSIRDADEPVTARQGQLIRWMKWLVYSQLLIFVPSILNIIFAIENITLVNRFFGMVTAMIQGYFLFFRPEILYGWGGDQSSGVHMQERGPEPGQVHTVMLSRSPDPQKMEWIRGTVDTLERHFEEKKPYLNQGYMLPDLAHELGCTTNQLSFLINHHYGIHFNTLINRYRVEACKVKLLNEEFREKTLEAIAQEVGFQSRSTFISAFKAETGKTPSAFVRELTKV